MKINIICENCNKIFQRYQSDLNYAIKKGHKHKFCSPFCRGSFYAKRQGHKGNGVRTESTSFTWFLLHSKIRAYPSQSKKGQQMEHKINIQDLINQWNKQNGVCPYTGWALLLPKNSSGWHGEKSIKRASLDRIDSQKGYLPDNIQFISIMANYAKNSFTELELIEFCHAVSINKKQPAGLPPPIRLD